jgi:hypothetical protein
LLLRDTTIRDFLLRVLVSVRIKWNAVKYNFLSVKWANAAILQFEPTEKMNSVLNVNLSFLAQGHTSGREIVEWGLTDKARLMRLFVIEPEAMKRVHMRYILEATFSIPAKPFH